MCKNLNCKYTHENPPKKAQVKEEEEQPQKKGQTANRTETNSKKREERPTYAHEK